MEASITIERRRRFVGSNAPFRFVNLFRIFSHPGETIEIELAAAT